MPTLLLLVVGDVRSGAGVVKFPAAAALLPPGRDSGPFRAYAQFSFLRPSVPLQFQIKSSAEGRKEGRNGRKWLSMSTAAVRSRVVVVVFYASLLFLAR